MKHFFLLLLFLPVFAQAQFSQSEKGGLTVIVTDGTIEGKSSPQRPPGNAKFRDPIRPIGMTEAIQAGAFLERPKFGLAGFILVFCVNDSVGGKQGYLMVNGEPVPGVYRLIRQKLSMDEQIPEGMTGYMLSGTVYFLGISG